jgi:alpha-2-macroglobulin
MKRARLLGALLLAPALVLMTFAAAPQKPNRAAAQKLMNDGNWKEAYDAFSALALDPADDPTEAGDDLMHAAQCLPQLNRVSEFDAFIEKVILAHKGNASLLFTAAKTYFSRVDHQGSIVAGNFVRGPHRGGTARYVSAFERDRIRALQLMVQAMGATEAGKLDGDFYFQLANMLLGNRGYGDAWRLQYLSDLDKLPDYEDGYYYGGGRGIGAAVNADGTPVYHMLPESWKAAKTDGERWRWALHTAAEVQPAMTAQVEMTFADFLRSQFGTETLAEYRWFFGRTSADDDTRKNESGTYALHTLGEDETIARLATGIKRFKLPDEFNYILIYKRLADEKNSQALDKLADLFENRRQYEKSADYWRKSIALGDPQGYKQKRLDQIEGNWGQFEPIGTQPAGAVGATVEFRFRNGKKVSFEAQEINVRKLLDDVKAYLKNAPKQLDWNKVNVADIGARLVRENQKEYILQQAAAWQLDLKPREHHFDRRVTVATPLQRAGAYLVSAKMEGGNTCYVVIWVADTAIVRKPMDKQIYCFVADAATGAPIPKANIEFFGYWQEWRQNPITHAGYYVVHTADSAEFTNASGEVTYAPKGDNAGNYQWVIIATTPEGRLAYLGFTGFWPGNYYDAQYNADKVYAITDRPVYRPSQPVKFKFWIDHAQYDQEGKSAFAGQSFTVQVLNPRSEKVFEKGFTADEYGGFDGELMLDKQATLGVYQILIPGKGGGNFRVEEYKKPEFEVKVKAPEEPVMLGEKFSASIEAKYYFGAPVTEAKVKYKIFRTGYSANWYPMGLWDWFYEPGYWWFACDYAWYPGWRDWGCRRPVFFWWGWRQPERPELVAEVESAIGKDGVVKVEIDTALAKEIHGDTDHKYEITAEVTDQSRRTIVGTGRVLVARKPFKVYAWVNRGHYRVGDVVHASFTAQTLDNKPVQGAGELRLLHIAYDKDAKPVETEVQKWDLPTDAQGAAQIQIKAAKAGQYRLSYKVTDSKQHTIEGGYVFTVMGEGVAPGDFRFNDIELVTDKREYAPGEKVNLLVNTARPDSWIVLFLRPANGMYQMPKIVHAQGKSTQEVIEVVKKDMPNFFVEAFTVADGRVYTETREVIVPPESRVLGVEVKPSAEKYKPGEKAVVNVKLTGPDGKPFVGSTVVSIYDKAVEYISGGSNVPEIKSFFWKWRRQHHPQTESSLTHGGYNLVRTNAIAMQFLGIFGQSVVEEVGAEDKEAQTLEGAGSGGGGSFGRARDGAMRQMAAMPSAAAPAGAPMLAMESDGMMAKSAAGAMKDELGAGGGEGGQMVEPTVRTQFADTAIWVGCLATDQDGLASVELKMPENLTTWKARVWAMGAGARVGEGAAEVVTTKNLIIRLQAPRFFVEKDEVVLSANVHNFLKEKKSVQVVLELDGDCLEPIGVDGDRADPHKWSIAKKVEIPAGSEKRVDWRVKAVKAGEATIRMKALTDEESDAMEMKFLVYVHGMLKTESFSGVIRPDKETALVAIRVPAERRPEQTRLEVRYSPTLAGAMVDALPYLMDYPYGCTEQTLNRFLPTVITQKVLLKMGLNLKEIREKRTNLNAQEIGDDVKRAADWSTTGGYMSRVTGKVHEPVFDEAVLHDMVKDGISALASMQCSDGGWGWFSGWGEHSWPHTTAYVVHGLQIARACDVALLPGMIERGVEWLQRYEVEQTLLIRAAEKKEKGTLWKEHADNLDAFVYMVLADEGPKADNLEMRGYLYRDRNELAVYAKAMFGLALNKLGDIEKRDMLMRNIDQFLVQDDENQTAYLNLPGNNWWWCWYGSEYEAQAYYLKLLSIVEPKGEKASRLVKYLINNRKHASYWNSTRDTAVCIESFADYIKASGEDKPDMTVTVLLDGKAQKEVRITPADIFSFDNKLVLEGQALSDGKHTIQFVKKGTGPLYFNAYLTNFTLEDPITKAGLEIKVQRKYYQLIEADKTVKVEGAHGQAVDQKAEKYERKELANLAMLKSGDLVEVELEIESKNDYEYIVLEDAKAAGFEPVDVRSGYNGNDMGAYVEFRDERTVFFVRQLARGKHSVSYRMRAETPGKFSALPTKASAMYAPELKANADEIKLRIQD